MKVTSRIGSLSACVKVDDSVLPGVVTLPHGYGQLQDDGSVQGPPLNRLVSSDWCEPFSKTPYHKLVPVNLEKEHEQHAASV